MWLNAGVWLDDCQKCGIQGDFFFLGSDSDTLVAGDPTGNAIVARPFFNALTGLNDAQLVTFPGIVSGTVTVDSSSTNLIGGGPSFVKNLCCDPRGRIDFVGGAWFMNLEDSLTITENLTSLGGTGVPVGTSIIVQDHFQTANTFYGGLIGLQGERRFGRCYIAARGALGMGVTHQSVTIDSSTTITPPGGAPTTFPGGLYAQQSNIDTYESDKFAVIPIVGLRFRVQATEHLRLFAGYYFLYWSNVARAGDQVDQRVNTNQLPPGIPGGPAVPAVRFKTTDYWLQGIGLGGELRF